jgi:hypothetical protein
VVFIYFLKGAGLVTKIPDDMERLPEGQIAWLTRTCGFKVSKLSIKQGKNPTKIGLPLDGVLAANH